MATKSMYRSGKTFLSHFDGIGEYCDYIKTLPMHSFSGSGIPGLNTYGASDIPNKKRIVHAEIERMRLGSVEHAASAQKVMDKLQMEGLLTTGYKLPKRGVVGGFTVLPLYEIGAPKCMIRREPSDIEGASTPMRIFYDRFASGGLDAQQLINRGVATLGFALAMASVRPIELYAISASCPQWPGSGGLFGSLIQIETQPINLAHAAYVMTSEAFTRSFTWASMHDHVWRWKGLTNKEKYNYAVGPFCGWRSNSPEYARGMRQAFNMDEQDILLVGANLFDKLALTDPVAWVREMLHIHVKRRVDGDDVELSSEHDNEF